jgi:hypothetical protein
MGILGTVNFISSNVKKVSTFFSKWRNKKGKKEKQIDLKEKKTTDKGPSKKKINNQETEPEKKFTKELEIEREKAANVDPSKASGRAIGGLEKVENASTKSKVNQKNLDRKTEEIEEKRDIEKETKIGKSEAESDYKKNTDDKNLEQILDKGKSNEGKSFAERVRPNKEMEFQSLDEKQLNDKTINLLKEDSSKFLMPANDNIQKPLKVDTYDIVTKSTGDIKAKEEANYFEELYMDEAANEPTTEMENDPDLSMDGAGDFDFD